MEDLLPAMAAPGASGFRAGAGSTISPRFLNQGNQSAKLSIHHGHFLLAVVRPRTAPLALLKPFPPQVLP